MPRVTISLLTVLVLGAGCATTSESASSPSPWAAPVSPSPTVVAVPSEPTPSAVAPQPSDDPPARPSSANTAPAASPIPGRDQQHRTPGVPDPTAAGPLTESDLPNPVLGFRAVPAEATEGEFNPNGTWVHAVDGPTAGFEAWPRCATRESGIPAPTYALAGRYADAADRPGNALVLQFASAAEARRYYDGYLADLDRCPREGTSFLVVTELRPGPDSYVARRRYASGGTWSEFARVREDRVLILLLQGDGVPLVELGRVAGNP